MSNDNDVTQVHWKKFLGKRVMNSMGEEFQVIATSQLYIIKL